MTMKFNHMSPQQTGVDTQYPTTRLLLEMNDKLEIILDLLRDEKLAKGREPSQRRVHGTKYNGTRVRVLPHSMLPTKFP